VPDDNEASGDDQESSRKRWPHTAPTIYDVARLAGVSPSTVSRALNVPGRINAKTESRVRTAAAELGFRTNPMARALPTGRTRTIALIVADITNPMIFGIVRGAEKAAAAADYTLIIAESQESSTVEAGAIERLIPSVDGLVLATTRMDAESIAALAQRTAVVLINRDVPPLPRVLPDVSGGVDQLVTHLHDVGHRSICYLSGPATSWMSARRWDALTEAAERHEMSVVEINPAAPTIDGGRSAYEQAAASEATAVVAYNDLMAMGFMQAAVDAGATVPGTFSVAGFDDIFGSELITPALTTVRVPLELAGELAVQTLLAHMDIGTTPPPTHDPLSAELIIRGSTGTPSALISR